MKDIILDTSIDGVKIRVKRIRCVPFFYSEEDYYEEFKIGNKKFSEFVGSAYPIRPKNDMIRTLVDMQQGCA